RGRRTEPATYREDDTEPLPRCTLPHSSLRTTSIPFRACAAIALRVVTERTGVPHRDVSDRATELAASVDPRVAVSPRAPQIQSRDIFQTRLNATTPNHQRACDPTSAIGNQARCREQSLDRRLLCIR